MDWQDRAACLGLALDIFFWEDTYGLASKDRADAAKRVCATCPVIDDCYTDALTWPVRLLRETGVVAGRTGAELIAERQEVRWMESHQPTGHSAPAPAAGDGK